MSTTEAPLQLTLLPPSGVPAQFRLDADTRRRGLQHVNEIRRLLAARQAAKLAALDPAPRRPIRSRAA
ncbi:MAG TPA: hypothetical protein VIS05_01865 [Ilumatobacter sp.]